MGKTKDTRFTDALRRAVMRTVEMKPESPDEVAKQAVAIDLLAETLISRGISGDVTAIKEIFDRLEGKAHQSIEAEVTTLTLADALQAAAAREAGKDDPQEG